MLVVPFPQRNDASGQVAVRLAEGVEPVPGSAS